MVQREGRTKRVHLPEPEYLLLRIWLVRSHFDMKTLVRRDGGRLVFRVSRQSAVPHFQELDLSQLRCFLRVGRELWDTCGGGFGGCAGRFVVGGGEVFGEERVGFLVLLFGLGWVDGA